MVIRKVKKLNDIMITTVREFMMNTTLHGYRHIAETDRHWFERIVWIVTQVLATWGVVYSILDIYVEFKNTPMVTTIDTAQYPIWNVPFPAVAVCNVNKISKTKAKLLAAKLKIHNPEYSEDDLFRLLRYLGRMYDQQVQGYDYAKELHEILSRHQPNYDVSSIMKELAPSCEDMLLSCMWRGKKEACTEMFRPMGTLNGYCCVFNHVQKSSSSNRTSSRRLTSTGYKMGLNVLIDPQPEDYYYPVLPTYGTQLLVFKSKDHPDTPSGLLEKLISSNTEMFFTLTATSRYTEPELRMIEPDVRGCLFEDETRKVMFGYGQYSYGRCLSRCSISSVIHLCGCLPFYFENPNSTRICNLKDLLCLFKNKEKFQNHRSPGTNSGNKEGDDDSLSCDECLPSCSDSSYNVQSSYAKISVPSYHRSELVKDVTLNYNHSIIHLYYSNVDTLLYRQDILYSWYELLSSFGGLCSLFNGFSFISIIEFLYFFTFRFFFIAKEKQQTVDSGGSREIRVPVPERQKSVYWNELGPK